MSVPLTMATIKKKTVLAVLGVTFPAWLWAAQAGQATPAESSLPQVGLLEHRFFFHQYPRDPVEKRLERLELLIFGSIQAGTNDERITRIKATVAERDRQSAGPARTAEKKPPIAEAKPGAAKGSSTQYPILNTLEWRALKKTFPQDSLDERLERLESKVFGQSSPAMAYADRVERLNRTLGIGASQEHPSGPLGPRPKAVPRGQYFGYGAPPGGGVPAPSLPFSSINPWDMNNQFNEMFRQLDQQMQQMQQMMQLPPGEYEWDYDSPGQTPQAPVKPNIKPHTAPAPRHPQQLPPYYDPNAT